MNPSIVCEPEALLDVEQTESTEERNAAAMLYVAVIDGKLRPRVRLQSEVEGASLRVSAVTDERGILFVDGCPPGGYTLSAQGLAATVHTLTPADVERSSEPYLSILR